ncbi:MAG: pilus assembly protein [Hyphomicrobiales bacterium]|nr:MAG: pilus assembly protein [Hyphomicrobiales bacterium]
MPGHRDGQLHGVSPLRGLKRFADDHRGASAVEFAIIAPVFILMIVGVLAYGIYFGAANSVQQIAADAARTSIAGLSASERNTLVTAFIENNAGGYVFIDPDEVDFTIGDDASDPNQYKVTVTYDASQLPIWVLPVPLPDKIISYTSTIRLGGI